jgi:hypothetical protein
MEAETLKVRCLHPVHYGIEHPRDAVIDLPVETANHLAQNKIVEILSTIVEPVIGVLGKPDESASSGEAAQTSIAQTEEATEAAKTTSKKRGQPVE